MASAQAIDPDAEIVQSQVWHVLDAYFGANSLVKHQIDSFETFMKDSVKGIIRETDRIQADSGQNTPIHNLDIEYVKCNPPREIEDSAVARDVYPRFARLRDTTYNAEVLVKVRHTIQDPDPRKPSQVYHFPTPGSGLEGYPLCKIPVMVGAYPCHFSSLPSSEYPKYGECRHDPGGYFIVNGSEKVLVAQERASPNHVFCFKRPPNDKWLYSCELKSLPETVWKDIGGKTPNDSPAAFRAPQSTYVRLLRGRYRPPGVAATGGSRSVGSGYSITVQINRVRDEVPLFCVFRALGVLNDPDILRYIVHGARDLQVLQVLKQSLHDGTFFVSQQDALEHIGRRSGQVEGMDSEKQIDFARQRLDKDLFSHISTVPGAAKLKAAFLGYMTRKLINTYLGREPQTDRDDIGNKRYTTAGYLMGGQFRLAYRDVHKTIGKQLSETLNKDDRVEDEAYDVAKWEERIRTWVANSNKITRNLEYALGTGNWSTLGRGIASKTGVSQVLGRLTYALTLSYLRRASTPIARGGKQTQPRMLHATTWGYICPCETPEGHQVGLVKNFALMSTVTVQSRGADVISLLENFGDLFTSLSEVIEDKGWYKANPEWCRVFVNGEWIGMTNNPSRLHKILVAARRRGAAKEAFAALDTLSTPDVDAAAGLDEFRLRGPSDDDVSDDGLGLGLPTAGGELGNDDDVIGADIGLVRDFANRELRVWTDCGRVVRPLFVVENLRLGLRQKHMLSMELPRHVEDVARRVAPDLPLRVKWHRLVAMNSRAPLLDLVDSEEQGALMIATFPADVRRNFVAREQATLAVEALRAAGRPLPTGIGQRTVVDIVRDGVNERVEMPIDFAAYSHCEIHPCMTFGICASVIPFPDHNQAPRNVYQSAMGKQALGVYATNWQHRLDTTSHVLFYPQRPLSRSKAMQYLRFPDLPAGHNAIVAIACYTGYNQEDSVIMNQGAIDRGFFRSLFFRTYAVTANEGKIRDPQIHKPDPTLVRVRGPIDHLDEDGIAPPGTEMASDMILVGMTGRMPGTEDASGGATDVPLRKDHSLRTRVTETSFVDKVFVSRSKDGYPFVKVRVRNIRIPQIGDKFASRHGQKGTCGITYNQDDLPFTHDGVSPDMIINPHAIPGRMTIGHLVECLQSKFSAIDGSEGDATPFEKIVATVASAKMNVQDSLVEQISNALHAKGYHKRGNEWGHCGHTGLPLETHLFIGPTYYQRLKHMVDDKMQARATGQMATLTRQPVEGRAKGGGMRFGEMERDCMVSHGATQWLKERLLRVSDLYRVHVCDTCGFMPAANLHATHEPILCVPCRKANRGGTVSVIHMPYACKLLFQELMALCIWPRIRTRPMR